MPQPKSDAFPWLLAPGIAIILVVMAVGYANPETFVVAFPVGIVLVLLVSLGLQVAVFRRLAELSLPDEYVAKFRVRSILVQLGNIAALSLLAYAVITRYR